MYELVSLVKRVFLMWGSAAWEVWRGIQPHPYPTEGQHVGRDASGLMRCFAVGTCEAPAHPTQMSGRRIAVQSGRPTSKP